MYLMRPADAADTSPIAAVIRARAAWMNRHAIHGGTGWAENADALAAQAADPAIPVWVLTDDSHVIACTTLLDESPAFLYTETERAEPAIFLASTVTHPDYAGGRLGCLIAWWTLDHAHQTGRTHVRRGTGDVPGLIRYYTQVQGWTYLRTVDRNGTTAYAFTRRAEPQPQIKDEIGTRSSR